MVGLYGALVEDKILALSRFCFARSFWSRPWISWYEHHAYYVGVIGPSRTVECNAGVTI